MEITLAHSSANPALKLYERPDAHTQQILMHHQIAALTSKLLMQQQQTTYQCQRVHYLCVRLQREIELKIKVPNFACGLSRHNLISSPCRAFVALIESTRRNRVGNALKSERIIEIQRSSTKFIPQRPIRRQIQFARGPSEETRWFIYLRVYFFSHLRSADVRW